MLIEEKIIADKNKVVSVWYELRLNSKDGDIVESVDKTKPFTFIYGTGYMLEKFEEKLKGMTESEAFDFVLTSDEAYGQRNEENMAEIPMSVFEASGKMEEGLLNIGNYIPLRDEAGNHYNGKVLSVKEDVVKLDFNHPLAGEDLYFAGAIVTVREASDEELAHGHLHDNCDDNCDDNKSNGCGCH